MIMYHGTIKGYADSILKDGLKPMPSQSFHVRNIAVPKGIYLTPDIMLASSFAITREEYSKVNPGEFIPDDMEFMWKRSDGQPRLDDSVDTTPVLVQVDIPDAEMAKWKPDPDFIGYSKAYRCECYVSPDRIKAVIPLPNIPNGGV